MTGFMPKPENYHDVDIVAIDRAYMDYSKFEDLTCHGVIYVTKKKLLFLSRAFLTKGGLLLEKADPNPCFKGHPGWLSVLL